MTDYRLPDDKAAAGMLRSAADLIRGNVAESSISVAAAREIDAWADAIDPPKSIVTGKMIGDVVVQVRRDGYHPDPDDAEAYLEAAVKCGWTPPGAQEGGPTALSSEAVRDIARELYLQAPFDDVPYEKLTYIYAEGHESDVRAVLAAARSAGWEMVEATELAALRELVAAAWDDVGDAFIAQEMTQAQADAIRKAKAAQR